MERPGAEATTVHGARRPTADEESALRLARVRALDRAPYLVPALYGLVLCVAGDRVLNGALAAADSSGRVYLDVACFMEQPLAVQAGVLVHEALHVLRKHGERGRRAAGTRPFEWALAAELEVNDDIADLGFSLPGGSPTPRSLGLPDGRAAEWYFAQPALLRRQPGCTARCGGGGHRCGSAPGKFCGGCAWGTGPDERRDLPSLDPVEIDVLVTQVAMAMRRYAASRGTLPAGMRRWLEEIETPPTVDWRRELRSALRSGILASQRGRTDYSRRRVSRRAENTDVAPGMVQYLPTVAFGIDTSGSMADSELAAGIAELDQLCRQVGLSGGRVSFFSVDAQASEVRAVRSVADIALVGGGGTDMRVAYQIADELRPRPDVFVLVTDGQTPWPQAPPPRMRCLVLTTQRDAQVPGWARAIIVHDG